MTEKKLDYILREEMDFGFSETERTSIKEGVRSKRPYFFCWRPNARAIDIVTIGNFADVATLKLYRVSLFDLSKGIDLDNEPFSLNGNEALQFLKQSYPEQK